MKPIQQLSRFLLLLVYGETPDSKSKSDYEWIQVTTKAPFAPRDGAGALVFQQKMWLIGGWNPPDKKHFPLGNNDHRVINGTYSQQRRVLI